MKKLLSISERFSIVFMFLIAGTLWAQESTLLLDFESNSLGDPLSTVAWSPADIVSVVDDDPLASGNNVLKNTVYNYNAAPVLTFVLPAGKTLADYDSLTFKGYFEKGDVAYKEIVAQAYQTKPTGHFLDADTLGLYNRAQGASVNWENISLDISNASAFSDTIYIALGINCAGTANGDTTTWYADDLTLVEKPAVTGPMLGTEQDFETYGLGDPLSTVAWSPADIVSVVDDDPLAGGNNVLKNTVHNYNAAPVLTFVLPAGKMLADYNSLTFKGYFEKGDVAYKGIVAQAYQTKPTGHFLDTDTLGLYNRAQGTSVNWENISLDISNAYAFSDTIYIALGINCAGTANGDTTTWYADDLTLVAKADTTPPHPVIANGDFEKSDLGDVTGTGTEGWAFYYEPAIDPAPVFEIVGDSADVQHGNRALKVSVNGLGTNDWDIQAVAESLYVVPGKTYDYSVWAKSSKAGATVNFTVGNYSYAEYMRIGGASLTTGWKQYTNRFTVSDDQTVIRAPIHFFGTASANSTIYIDNLQIVQVGPPVYEGPPLAQGQPKFVGNIYSGPQIENFKAYWNQVIPENAGKWGSVEGTRDVMNWSGLDAAYKLAKDNDFPFGFHVLVWGAQQPAWIDTLEPAEQLQEIEEWFQAVANRYPDIDYLQVVNEPLPGHNPPDGSNGRADYKAALGGNGASGWDWVITAFRMAREIFPAETKLMINDFNIINSSSNTNQYINIINLLKAEDLIDIIGVQGHAFTTTASAATMKANLDALAATGLPIHVTELDIDGPSDAIQLQDYQRIFPVLYEHPGVEGITLWGWRPGLWRNDEGAYIINEDGTERPALKWLRDYLASVVISVEDNKQDPHSFQLYNNYPNPFNPSTTIGFSLPKKSNVKLSVYNILGEEVAVVMDGQMNAGEHRITFKASNLSSGLYFYRLTAGEYVAVKKMMLIK